MEKRIKRGQYDFPETEWSIISDEAKGLIDGMLETVPERRLTIDKIMKSKWLMVSKKLTDFRGKNRSFKISIKKSILLRE